MTYTAVVPARSGSKRLPHKNVMLLGQKPLIIWTLEACIQSNRVNEVIFSTDSLQYWELANEYIKSSKLVLDLRDPSEADDSVKIFDYLKEKRTKLFGERAGAFILALPTAPLRQCRHLEEAITLYETSGTPVFSATKYSFPISFAFEFHEPGNWHPLFSDSPMLTGNTRSQNQQEFYHPNGAIYIRDIKDLSMADLSTLYVNALPYLMSQADSIDIDGYDDFKMAEALL